MNEGSSFRSLQQLVSSVQTNLEMSGDHSVGAIGPIFDPNAQVGSQDSQIAGGLPGAKPYRTFVWVDDIAQVTLPQMAKRSSSTRGFAETLWWRT